MESQGVSEPNDMEDYDAVTSRSSAKRLAAIISKFDNLKKKLVVQTGFGGLLHLPQINVNQRKFNVWLLAHIDPEKRAIVVNDVAWYIQDKDVQLFLGIPCGPNMLCGIDSKDPEEKIDFIRLAIGSMSNNPEELNSLKAAEEVITKVYPQGMDAVQQDQFKTSFVCYAIGEFLVAKSKANHGITDFWGSLLKPKEIPTYNFCSMVIDEIMLSARKVQYLIKAKKTIPVMSGCTLFLEGFYLIMRKYGKIDPPTNNLRIISGLDCDTIKKLMLADQAGRKMLAEVPNASSSAGTKSANRPVKKVVAVNQPSASAPPKLFNTVPSIKRKAINSFLDSYLRGEIGTKLSVAQVLDLKWHNARLIHHITALKTVTEETTSIAGQTTLIDKATTLGNLDMLLTVILEDNVKLAKRLHDHAPQTQFTQSASKIATSSCKRSASEHSYDGSSSDCTSINKRAMIYPGGNGGSTVTSTLQNTAKTTGTVTESSKNIHVDASAKVDPVTPKLEIMPLKPEESSFVTPTNLKSNVAFTPETTAMHMSEAALLYRILEAEDRFTLNARALENEFSSSPIEKIVVQQGQIAKNPWEQGLKKTTGADKVAEKVTNWLMFNDSEELDRTWIIHAEPRHIEITGHALKNIILKGLPFSYELFDLSSRRFSQLDRWMYGQGTKLCFSHIFESDFAMFVLANEDPLGYRSIRNQFSGTACFYDISQCRMLSVPALVNQTWCAYFWDMQLHCVHILDPTFIKTRAEELKNLHDYNVNKIKKALATCISSIFSGWNIDIADWPNNYVKPIVAGVSDRDSGLVTLLALRDFNGHGFGQNHDEASINNFKAFLLYEDLSIDDNNGVLPSGYVTRIDE